jgi:Cys-rich protein (TIGR01571 family)
VAGWLAGACAWFLPCVLVGRIAEIVDEGRTCKKPWWLHAAPPWAACVLLLAYSYEDFWSWDDAAPLNCCPIEEKNDKNARNDIIVVFCRCCFFCCAACLTAGCIYYCLQSCTGCGCLYTYSFRTRLRNKYGLELKPCDDCCTDCWCLPCSLSQQIRELQNRGIDPSLGTCNNQLSSPAVHNSSSWQFWIFLVLNFMWTSSFKQRTHV